MASLIAKTSGAARLNEAKALMAKAPELLAEPPKIEKADVLADRLLG
jgi:hypothetical protein